MYIGRILRKEEDADAGIFFFGGRGGQVSVGGALVFAVFNVVVKFNE